MLVALGVDAAFGWPRSLEKHLGHPIAWLGAAIALLERLLYPNDASQHCTLCRGVGLVVIVVVGAACAGLVCQYILPPGWPGAVVAGLVAVPLIAARSLYEHVVPVAQALEEDNLNEARKSVAMIVGRDPSQLDEPGVARAAVESLAENTSDAVIAPLVWGVLLGLPGLAAYKAINTLDSMIGHRNERYRRFGWAAARLDDVVNFVPARLTGVLFAISSRSPIATVRLMLRDAGHHRSPNAGWPESAIAGLLGVRLSGPRSYGDGFIQEPWINGGGQDPTAGHIRRGLKAYLWVCVIAAGVLALLVALLGI